MTELVLSPATPLVTSDQAADRVRALVAAFLLSKKNLNTRKAYRRDLLAWIDWCEENEHDPLNVRRVHLDAWSEVGAGLTPEKPANTTMARRLSAVSSWYTYLLREEVLEKTPTAYLERPPVDPDHSDTRGLTLAEARDVMVAGVAHSRRAKVITSLGLLDGLRCDEMVQLDVEDFGTDQGHRTLDVSRKGGYKQRVPVAPVSVAALEECIGDRTSGPILITSTGRRITPDRVFRIVRQVAALAELDQPETVSPHSLRHSFITLALEDGVPLHVVQDAAGHKTPRTTRRYDKNRNQLAQHPAYRLAAKMASLGS
jgi:site-specific recombinase XerD